MPGRQILPRLQRLGETLRETRRARGLPASVALLCRILLLKGPLQLRQMGASRKAAALRQAIAKSRVDLTAETPYLAFALTGGLGDYIVIARFIRDLTIHIGNIKFDTYSPNPTLASWIFGLMPGFQAAYYDILFDQIVSEYDVSIRANQFVVVYEERIRWRSVRDHRRLVEVINKLIQFRPKIEMFIDRHPMMDNFLARTAVFGNATRRDFLHKMAGLSYSHNSLPVPRDATAVSRIGLRPGQYVTVHNGFDTGFVITTLRATKCYPHFGSVVTLLKATFPDLQFVQIGTVTSEPIPECDLVLLNKTSLDEVTDLLAHAILHLDNESGLVHLAACLGTRSVVIFGPTPSDYFGYPDNINIDPSICGNCWWMARTWMDGCAKGYAMPRCMAEQPPEVVARLAQAAIAEALMKPQNDGPDGVETPFAPYLTEVAS